MIAIAQSKLIESNNKQLCYLKCLKTRKFLIVILGMLTGHVAHTCLNIIFGRSTGLECLSQTLSVNTKQMKPRVLCYVNTFPAQYDKKAIHVHRTWARRCTKTWITSTKSHPNLPVMMLNLTQPETRMHLWVKMRRILRLLYQEADQFDFFYKADDDTYAVIENLKAALRYASPDQPFMTGYRWNILCPGGYFSGGPGYVLSREALKRIVSQAIDKHPDCPTTDEDKEDVKMCLCGRAVGVRLTDLDGETKRSMFYPYSPEFFFRKQDITNQPSIDFDPKKPYLRRSQFYFSKSHIGFHYIEPKWMYTMEFLIYFLDPLRIPKFHISKEELNFKVN